MTTYSLDLDGERHSGKTLAELWKLLTTNARFRNLPHGEGLVYDDDTGALVGHWEPWHNCIYAGPLGRFGPSHPSWTPCEKLFNPDRDIPRAPDPPSTEKGMTIKEAALGAGVAFAIMPAWTFPWALVGLAAVTADAAANAIVNRAKRHSKQPPP